MKSKVIAANRLYGFVKHFMGYDIPRSVIRSWNDERRQVAHEYFRAQWYRANDNDVKIPKCPKWLKIYIDKAPYTKW